jgi:indolepyruvate ferredoxin oxidoreductase alpha subunit
MMGNVVDKVDIEAVLRGIGVTEVATVNPLDLAKAVETVRKTADLPGVKAIIFRSPCVAVSRPASRVSVDPARCVGCKKCIREIGCPALSFAKGKAQADPAQCTGCSLCAQLCPAGAIIREE